MTPVQSSLWESVQHPELQRVSGRIAQSVIAFCRAQGEEPFFTAQLAAYVMARCGGAPGSADRVMRFLRASGAIDVECIDRAASCYRVKAVRP